MQDRLCPVSSSHHYSGKPSKGMVHSVHRGYRVFACILTTIHHSTYQHAELCAGADSTDCGSAYQARYTGEQGGQA
ncbi:hypothetical protein DPMN_040944 [Dreissena polymorpha]|uniref:Uncharacterized protein n=1 Tax=Dreissena polymorpha TaxID=45954 RepID=A0A9D4CWY4_DREPO|nr:hypothetical protein DPMN_040944 [Dreissena polymorpha]